ncbi:MAG: hypothetical protein JW751_26005 [Polyangiaceae bacterium]|nr:hypothetical protein [Polyangiaceae bacterium]
MIPLTIAERSASPSVAAAFAAIRAAMRRYVSTIIVESVIQRALTHLGNVPLTTERLETVVEDSMVGLRLFVDPNLLPNLMVELTDILTEAADAERNPRTLSGTVRASRPRR